MSTNIRNIVFNTILVLLSILLGLLTTNFFLVFISNNNNQRQNFPRNLLHYLEPIARWSYPDYKNSETNSKSLFILGDSYAEGLGDLYLKGSYKYSIGHFLNEKWRKNTNIYLAANYGSNIPIQLFLLEKHLKGHSKNLTGMPIKSNNFNLILYFYEGNDVEGTFFMQEGSPSHSFPSKLRLQFPIIYTLRTLPGVVKNKILSKFPNLSPVSLTTKKVLENNICVGSNCRIMPPLQSAAAGLSEKEIINQINYLEDSVKKFSLKYPKANMCLVYIPSPATIYSPKEDFYYQHFDQTNESLKTNSKLNNKNSLLIRRLMRDRFDSELMTFVDPTQTIQKQAFKRFIHPKSDPWHFNEFGYQLLADATSQGCSLR